MGMVRRRLSYADVMATIALFVALGGSSYAVADRGGGERSGSAQARAAQASGSGGGAWGRVDAAGNLSRSRNVAGVSRVGPGIYCIRVPGQPRRVRGASDLHPSRTGVVATPDFSNDATRFDNTPGDAQAVVEWVSTAGGCRPGEFEVNTGIRHADGRIERANQGFFFSIPASPAAATRPTRVSPGLRDVVKVTSASARTTEDFKAEVAECPAGSTVTGGGYSAIAGALTFPTVVRENLPAFNVNGWQAQVTAPNRNEEWRLTVYALCARR